MMIDSGKIKLLNHPLIETFVEKKWFEVYTSTNKNKLYLVAKQLTNKEIEGQSNRQINNQSFSHKTNNTPQISTAYRKKIYRQLLYCLSKKYLTIVYLTI